MSLVKSFISQPGYTLMRGPARFKVARNLVTYSKKLLDTSKVQSYEKDLLSRLNTSIFPGVDIDNYLSELNSNGACFGLELPSTLVNDIRDFADENPVYAFRDPTMGFHLKDIDEASSILGRDILLAQYFNIRRDCEAISTIISDPVINLIALKYLGSLPIFMGLNLWWTFPVISSREDKLKHAHFFHRDIDDFKFLKFFFYLTDVEISDGGHWVVLGSHEKSPHIKLKDWFITRRFEDEEINNYYHQKDIIEVVGSKGLGFTEDTLCVHKAATPSNNPRLVLQLQFGILDFVPESDRRNENELKLII